MENYIIINNSEEIKNFIKNIEDVNQIMKGIYCNVTNFEPIYTLTNKKAYYINKECIPEIVEFNFEEEIFNDKFKVTVPSISIYRFFRDNKKYIKNIKIDSKNIIFEAEVPIENSKIPFKNVFELKYDSLIDNKMKDIYKNFHNLLNHNFSMSDYRLNLEDKDLIQKILNSKNLITLVLDLDEEIIYEKTENTVIDSNTSFTTIGINKKFLNGAYYKVKHLKKGDTFDYSPIYIDLVTTNRDDIIGVRLNVISQKGTIEHKFMICDF